MLLQASPQVMHCNQPGANAVPGCPIRSISRLCAVQAVQGVLHTVFKISCLKNIKQTQVQQRDLQSTTQYLLALSCVLRIRLTGLLGAAPYAIASNQTGKEYDNLPHCAQHDVLSGRFHVLTAAELWVLACYSPFTKYKPDNQRNHCHQVPHPDGWRAIQPLKS